MGQDVENANSWDWTTVSLKSVKIEYLAGPLPKWLPEAQASLAGASRGSGGTPLPATMVAAKPCRLTSLGCVSGADYRTPPPASVSPEGVLVVSGSNAVLAVPASAVVVFAPLCALKDFRPDQVELIVDGRRIDTKGAGGNKGLPRFEFQVPASGPSSHRVQLVAQDASHKRVGLSDAVLRVAKPGLGVQPSLVLSGEKLQLVAGASPPKAMYVFLEGEYAGAVTSKVEAFSVDTRALSPGQYRFWVIPENEEGELLPPTASTISIPARFRLSSFATNGTVEVKETNLSIPVRVARLPGNSAEKAFVYVGGAFVGEANIPDSELQVSVRDVPSGDVKVEVVGVGKDGFPYPPESIAVHVNNIYWNAQAAADARYATLQEWIKQIGYIDQEIDYWYTRALNEPDFVIFSSGVHIFATDGFSRFASLSYIDSITVPGRVADYLGTCRAAIVKRAQVRFEIGKLYKALGRRDSARTAFQQVIQEAGETSGVGSAAKQELAGL